MPSNMNNYFALVKKQYKFKLKAYVSVFNSLIILQLLAILFSFNPTSSRGFGGYGVDASLNNYSANISIVFTFLWGFITAFIITTKAYREDDFTFVSNNQSQGMANILYLLTISFIGGITAILSGYLYHVMFYFTTNTSEIYTQTMTLTELFIAIVATSLFILFCCALGYLAGILVQLHKIFGIILPVVFIGLLMFNGISGGDSFLAKTFFFYFQEGNLVIFILKITITSSLLFLLSISLFRNKEARV
ncbi:MAG TPA: hypothetical protein VK072_06705 [Candidatus Avamphibacillus sp.]|nr:hypothetical protein [Candidatus Avamphibacillus sp.]